MIIKQDMYFPYVKEYRQLHIYLPDHYYDSDERYPVMYFFDGHNLFHDSDATYGKSWGLETFLNNWDKDMIIVGMECSHTDNHRLIEYSPYHLSGKFWGDIDGIGEETFQWIINDIKPYIDSHYRTYGHREATGIGGSSMGGLMSLYGVIVHNDIFSKGACLSSAVRPCIKDVLRDINRSYIHEDTKIYLSWGTLETRRYKNQPLEKTLIYRVHEQILQSLPTTDILYYIQESGKHNEASWEKQNSYYMNYLWMNRRLV